jgi:hypothetical protein
MKLGPRDFLSLSRHTPNEPGQMTTMCVNPGWRGYL